MAFKTPLIMALAVAVVVTVATIFLVALLMLMLVRYADYTSYKLVYCTNAGIQCCPSVA
jgi:hypothetical protein